MRSALGVLLAGTAAICLVAGLARVSLAPRPAPRAAHLEAQGLDAPLEILRDAGDVPHVLAAGERDAWFGLGLVHARDRLAQVLALRAVARGRSAETRGPAGLPADRVARWLGIARHAEARAAELPRRVAEPLGAYAAGVNAQLARHRAGLDPPPPDLPPGALDRAEPWTPADSIAVMKLVAWALDGSVETHLVLADLIEALGPAAAAPFFPAATGASAESAPGAAPSPGAAAARARPGWSDPLRAAVGLDGAGRASSAWVVSGGRSRSGAPLLAGQLHLAGTRPALLHRAHVAGGGLDVAGSALPGTPAFFTGRNARVAWSAVPARAVVVDLYVETLRGDDPQRYHDGARWRELAVRDEVLRVRGEPDVTLRVRETQHGPLLGDLYDAPREPLAVAWAGARKGDGVGALLALARAHTATELRAALDGHHEPALVFAYVDAGGEAGLALAGWLPQRGLPSGLVPVMGRSEWTRWQGRVAPARLPHVRAERGVAVAADGALPSAERPEPIEWLWRSGQRAARIGARLAAAERPLDVRDLARIQADVHSAGSRDRVRAALALAGDLAGPHPEEREMAALLSAWDGEAGPDSVGAAVYHVFHTTLERALLARALGETLAHRYISLVHRDPGEPLGAILEAATAGRAVAGVGTPEELGAEVRAALRETRRRLRAELGSGRARWRWERLHVWSPWPFPGTAGGPRGQRALAGDPHGIAASGWDPRRPFAVRSLVRHAFAIDSAELDKALVRHVPGEADAGLLLTSRLLIEESPRARLTVAPPASAPASGVARR